jgi:DNA-binding HxlR family transcriptional regulator
MSQQEQLGVDALKLLAETWMVAILRALARGALRPAEIERALTDGGHSVVMLRLRHLLERGLVTYEHQPGLPPHASSAPIPRRALYSLTDAGRMLLEIAAGSERWAQDSGAQAKPGEKAGTCAIRLLADDHTRTILLLLAGEPRGAPQMDELTPGLGRSALRRRLRELVLSGMLARRKRGRVPLYELTAGARQLASVAMIAGRWEWRWARPERAASGDEIDEHLAWWAALLPPA